MERQIRNLSFGITSQCLNMKHVYFGDIDQKLTGIEIRDIAVQLQEFGLSDIIVLETCNGYNFIALDKIDIFEVYEINETISYMDKEFNKHNYNRKYYTLRMGEDKKLYAVFKDTNCYSPQDGSKSNGHRVFFNNLFDLNIAKDDYFDNSTFFQVVYYQDSKERVNHA
jgi:hypothetical protein